MAQRLSTFFLLLVLIWSRQRYQCRHRAFLKPYPKVRRLFHYLIQYHLLEFSGVMGLVKLSVRFWCELRSFTFNQTLSLRAFTFTIVSFAFYFKIKAFVKLPVESEQLF